MRNSINCLTLFPCSSQFTLKFLIFDCKFYTPLTPGRCISGSSNSTCTTKVFSGLLFCCLPLWFHKWFFGCFPAVVGLMSCWGGTGTFNRAIPSSTTLLWKPSSSRSTLNFPRDSTVVDWSQLQNRFQHIAVFQLMLSFLLPFVSFAFAFLLFFCLSSASFCFSCFFFSFSSSSLSLTRFSFSAAFFALPFPVSLSSPDSPSTVFFAFFPCTFQNDFCQTSLLQT